MTGTRQTADVTTIDTVVIGGGQAGLAAGYFLRRAGRDFVILDAHARVGDAWRTRWDTLVLFTPNRYNALPGLKYPGPTGGFATKDEFADYLEGYAAHVGLDVRTSTRVQRLSRIDEDFLIQTDGHTWRASNVIVAMNTNGRPRVPAMSRDLDPDIHQLHSEEFTSADDLPAGPVLVVGLGNSGADIAVEVVRTHDTWVAGQPIGAIPWRIESRRHRYLLSRIMRFVGHRVLNRRNPLGRKALAKISSAPLIRIKPKDLVAAGTHRVGRITGVSDGKPVTEDGQVLDVASVIWCTGYRPAFAWIDLPILGEGGEPLHEHGVVPSVPGLYFLGLEFQTSITSGTITGLGRDGKRIVKHLDRRPTRDRELASVR